MFDQILQLVKEHIGATPQVSSAIPADKADAIQHEIATYINNGPQNQTATQGGVGGLLSSLASGVSGSPVWQAYFNKAASKQATI